MNNSDKIQIMEMVRKNYNDNKSKITELYNNLKNAEKICVFGAGQLGSSVVNLFYKLDLGIKVDFICDNDVEKWGKTVFRDIKCISPKELATYKNRNIIIIIATKYHKEIYEQLKQESYHNLYSVLNYFGFKNAFLSLKSGFHIEEIGNNLEKLIDVTEDFESKQTLKNIANNWFSFYPENIKYKNVCQEKTYFTKEIVLGATETFVDAGAFDGDTIREFLSETQNSFEAIHSFEMDFCNYEILMEKIKEIPEINRNKITIYNIGLWDEKEVLKYNALLQGSNVDCEGEQEAKLDCLDDLLQDKDITYIKMDIEGAELKALKGAQHIIKMQRPKLAICLYHNPEDLWEIPNYIKQIVPEYKIYFRQHMELECESVCYAVIP